MSEVTSVGYCPRCGNAAPQKLIHTQTFTATYYSRTGERMDSVEECYVAACMVCGGILIYEEGPGESVGADNFSCAELVWPERRALPASVPLSVREIYAEAALIREVAPNAFAVTLRKAIEAICDDRGAPGGGLYNKLLYLAERGEIPPVVAQMGGVLRRLGNLGAHSEREPVQAHQVFEADRFFRLLVDYVYVLPTRIAAFVEEVQGLERRGDV